MPEMNEDEDQPYEVENGPGVTFHVRISRTAGGIRTYTVGATIPWGDFKKGAVKRVFFLERAVTREIDEQRVEDHGEELAEREDSIISTLADREWHTTQELLLATGLSRGNLIQSVSKLVRDKVVAYKPGGGRGKASKYRLIQK